MKFYKLSITIIITAMSLTSCHKKLFAINGKGDITSESRSISNFDKINLAIDADIVYIQDSIYSVVVKAQSNVLKVLTTKVSGSTLKIDLKRLVINHKKIILTI